MISRTNSKSLKDYRKTFDKISHSQSSQNLSRRYKKFRNSIFNPQNQQTKFALKSVKTHKTEKIDTQSSFLQKLKTNKSKLISNIKNQKNVENKINLSRQTSLPATPFKITERLPINESKLISMSQRIKKQQETTRQKFEKAFQYILDRNKQYLRERSLLRYQKAKPFKKNINFEKSKLLSSYQDSFQKKKLIDLDLQVLEPRKSTLSFSNKKVCGLKSTSTEIHDGKQEKKMEIATWDDGWKLSGPLYTPTTYNNNYPDHGKFQKVIPFPSGRETQLGMKFNGKSSYRESFTSLNTSPSKLAKWNNLRPIGNDFNRKSQSTYNLSHHKQEIIKQQWKPYQHRILKVYGIFNSQYKNEFKDKTKQATNTLNRWQD